MFGEPLIGAQNQPVGKGRQSKRRAKRRRSDLRAGRERSYGLSDRCRGVRTTCQLGGELLGEAEDETLILSDWQASAAGLGTITQILPAELLGLVLGL